jgi:hypothetical protein
MPCGYTNEVAQTNFVSTLFICFTNTRFGPHGTILSIATPEEHTTCTRELRSTIQQPDWKPLENVIAAAQAGHSAVKLNILDTSVTIMKENLLI